MSNPSKTPPRALILGCEGTQLTDEEREFFGAVDPFGFILFARNCGTPEQIAGLTRDLRACVDRTDAPILIDQEGGRVQRLKPPQWRAAPPAGRFGELSAADPVLAEELCRLNARLIAEDLRPLGIDVDCLPCLDLRHPSTSTVIGDRSFSLDPALVVRLARAQMDGLRQGGVLPVMKHVPGHGRAQVDSHFELPVIEEGLDELRQTDLAPFRELADQPMAMTAHIVVNCVDPERPATQSPAVIDGLIRGEIGFKGLLMTDDLGMQALCGGFAERAQASLQAGCDIVLHCSGAMAEMREVAPACTTLADQTWSRWLASRQDWLAGGIEAFDADAAQARLEEALGTSDA